MIIDRDKSQGGGVVEAECTKQIHTMRKYDIDQTGYESGFA